MALGLAWDRPANAERGSQKRSGKIHTKKRRGEAERRIHGFSSSLRVNLPDLLILL
jgi:hypothetical protein